MSSDNAYAVELKGVTFKRGARTIFDNVDLVFPRGKVTLPAAGKPRCCA